MDIAVASVNLQRARVRRRGPTRGAGFSIVELAVVIIVFGVALMLTLKGTVLIDVARAFAASYDVQFFQSRMQLYTTQYRYLPGDDPKAAARFGHPEASRTELGVVIRTVGDSKIDGKFTDFDDRNGEQFMFWRDMRYARLLDGNPALEGPDAMPANPFGGVYGIDEGNLGQKKGSICFNKVPGAAVQRVLDDLTEGAGAAVDIGVTSQPDFGPEHGHYDKPEPPPYNVEKTYIICVPLLP
jgi:hypothetical protein